MLQHLKKTYPYNPFRPNTGVFKDRPFTLAIAINKKSFLTIENSKFPYKGYESCTKEEYLEILKENEELEKYITKPYWWVLTGN